MNDGKPFAEWQPVTAAEMPAVLELLNSEDARCTIVGLGGRFWRLDEWDARQELYHRLRRYHVPRLLAVPIAKFLPFKYLFPEFN